MRAKEIRAFLFIFYSGFRAQIEILPIDKMDFSKKDVAGVIFQYPDTTGNICDPSNLIARAKEHGVNMTFSYLL
jgi:glycine cleavage system pyridoxal-binding protein P